MGRAREGEDGVWRRLYRSYSGEGFIGIPVVMLSSMSARVIRKFHVIAVTGIRPDDERNEVMRAKDETRGFPSLSSLPSCGFAPGQERSRID